MKHLESLVWLSSFSAISLLGCGTSILGSGSGGGGATDVASSTGAGTASSSSGGGACTDTSADPHNCGACGHDCLGGACAAGACQPVTLATVVVTMTPLSIAVDGDDLFWTTVGPPSPTMPMGDIVKMPKGGGTPTTLLSGQYGPAALMVDATNLYFRTDDALVKRLPRNGGAAPVMGMANANGGPDAIAISSAELVYADYDSGVLFGVPLTGGPATVLATGLSFPACEVVVGTNVFCGDGDGVRKIPVVPNSGSIELLSAEAADGAMVVDATSVYWTSGGKIRAMFQDGGNPRVLGESGSISNAIAVDDQFVYWEVNSVGQHPALIQKAPIGGGPTVTIMTAPSLHNPEIGGIAVDATSVYWTITGPNNDGGAIMRLAK